MNKTSNVPTTPCPANEMPKEIKDTMWGFLMWGEQKANIPALEDAVEELCHAAAQKNAGQKPYAKTTDIDWRGLDWTMWRIVIEATALVLSGELDKLKESEDKVKWNF